MTTYADKVCHGYGIAAHLADGGMIEVTAPVRMLLCGPCWHRWREVKDLPDWSRYG